MRARIARLQRRIGWSASAYRGLFAEIDAAVAQQQAAKRAAHTPMSGHLYVVPDIVTPLRSDPEPVDQRSIANGDDW